MELFRALAVLCEPPSEGAGALAEALRLGTVPAASEYTELFVFQLYPYASVYLGAEGMLGGEAQDRVAGFWRALGQTPPPDADHLSVMLALYARLVELEKAADDARHRELWRKARGAFLWEHLLSWLPVYLAKLDKVASPFYRRWGKVLSKALGEEAQRVGRPATLPLQLREASGLADPRAATAEEFMQSILTPARTGMILVGADLGRFARRYRLGARIGERRFILRSLFTQDARAVFTWLIEEADGWAAQHLQSRELWGPVGEVWAERAQRAAALLRELMDEAHRVA